jgi:hypothetical protein
MDANTLLGVAVGAAATTAACLAAPAGSDAAAGDEGAGAAGKPLTERLLKFSQSITPRAATPTLGRCTQAPH